MRSLDEEVISTDEDFRLERLTPEETFRCFMEVGFDAAVKWLRDNDDTFYYSCEGGMSPSQWAEILEERKEEILK